MSNDDNTSPIVIAGAARTPMGAFQGSLGAVSAPKLGGVAIAAALADAGADKGAVDELLMGCVLPAGLGQAPARQAGFEAGLGEAVPASTLNKVCGSGMKTVMTAHDLVRSKSAALVVAGGMESMTNAPYLSRGTRGGARLGHQTFEDHMFLDGLEDAYDRGRLMGSFAEDCASHYQFSRKAQDKYAIGSLDNALAAQKQDAFDGEIAPVGISTRKGETTVDADEQPANARPEKIPKLKPAFAADGTVTAANSSSISDGAAALVITSQALAEKRGLKVRARIVAHAGHAQAPQWFTTAPVPAAKKVLEKSGWSRDEVDLWEVNEAFAVVPMAFMHEMGLSREKVNVNGGACALGHPIGASGSRIIVTLVNALEKRGLKRGIAAICIGGGEGTAIAIERV